MPRHLSPVTIDDVADAIAAAVRDAEDRIRDDAEREDRIREIFRCFGPNARCACGLTRRQHDEGWPACKGFRPVG